MTNTIVADALYRRTHNNGAQAEVIQIASQFFIRFNNLPAGVANVAGGEWSDSLDAAQAEADRRSGCAQPCDCPGWEMVR